MACVVKKSLVFFSIIVLTFLSSCMSIQHVDKKKIENNAGEWMKCIVNEDADGLFAFYNNDMKENYTDKSLKEIQQFFDYIDGNIVSYNYVGTGGGQETIDDGKISYYNCNPEFDFTTDTDKTYTINFSYHYIWNEHPEYEGINMISICEDNNWSNKLVIGRNYYND